MLTLLTGTPGSGKTLYAVDKIIKISSKELSEFKNIEYIYTNIGGFKFEKFNDSDIKISKLVFQDLYVHIKILFNMFLVNEHHEDLDDILQKYCKENNLLNAYFIIDEAHNYFDNQDKAKNWWFTYHRHLNHEILLITQNKSLINTQYRNIPELFIKAQPISKAISKTTMRYFNYTDFRMIQKYSTTEIKINDTYFDLYTSGNVSSQKLVGTKYIIMFLIFLLFFILIFAYFFYNFFLTDPFASLNPNYNNKQEPKKEYNTNQFSQNTLPQNQSIQNSQFPNNPQNVELLKVQENLKLFKFNCFKTFCYYKVDDKNTLEIPVNILTSYFRDIDLGKKYFYMNGSRLVVYLLVEENKFNFIKGVQNENKKPNPLDVHNYGAVNK